MRKVTPLNRSHVPHPLATRCMQGCNFISGDTSNWFVTWIRPALAVFLPVCRPTAIYASPIVFWVAASRSAVGKAR